MNQSWHNAALQAGAREQLTTRKPHCATAVEPMGRARTAGGRESAGLRDSPAGEAVAGNTPGLTNGQGAGDSVGRMLSFSVREALPQ
eukprot:5612993-Lingulodinium_polyedra.AAC.1